MVTLHHFAVRGRVQARWAADENDSCAAAAGGFGQGVAHFAAGAVADEANRIEGLARAAGGDQNDFASQIVAAAQRGEHRVGDGLRLGHAAGADHAAGQIAGSGLDDAHAALAQHFKIGLGGRMVPHVDVHGRSNHDRRSGGEIQRGEKVVGDAVSELGQDVGGSGSDDERVGPLRLGDVLDGVLLWRFGRAGSDRPRDW